MFYSWDYWADPGKLALIEEKDKRVLFKYTKNTATKYKASKHYRTIIQKDCLFGWHTSS